MINFINSQSLEIFNNLEEIYAEVYLSLSIQSFSDSLKVCMVKVARNLF